jgi:two-component system, LytTR family, sensor kinase
VLASPTLVFGEYVMGHLHGNYHADEMTKEWGNWQSFATHEIPIWIASITSFLLTYGFGLALVMGFAFYRRLRDSQLRSAALERALTQSHLAALRMQLSPHTLFNLLHTIRGQITWDPPAAQAMVVQLGDLLRRLLTAGEREFSRLSDELQFVSLYLELQQRRFADRLTIRVPMREDVAHAWVPSLILQPLVENAVKHGLSRKRGGGTVRIDAILTPEYLQLIVGDDGLGMPDAALARVYERGIGLRNLRDRLERLYGPAHLPEITSEPGSGTEVRLRLPVRPLEAAA